MVDGPGVKLGVRERDEDNELSVWMRMMKREDWKGLVGRRGEERRERETYEKFPNELVHAEPRRQRVSSGSQLATVNTPWSRSSG